MVSLNNQTYAASPFAWQMRGTSKLLRGISAPAGVDFDLRVVKVVAPVGETRVGKPTLMNISSGAHRADEGSIQLFGETVINSPPHLMHTATD